MRILYDVGFFIFSIFYLPFFFLKGKWNRDSWSRFGRIPEEALSRLQGRRVLWVHAVSVGEIGLAVSFLSRIRDEYPGTQFLITTTTVAGHEVAGKLKNEEDVLLYFPVDFRFAVRSFVRQTSPAAVVLFETEIWPNLLWELSARSVPVMVLNGRLSDRAFRRYGPVRLFLGPLLRRLCAIGVQDARMAGRFEALGADRARITVTGNLKFDWSPPPALNGPLQELKRFCRRPSEFLFVAGSTHDGEEEKLFDVYARVKERHAHFRLLVAPRHLQRVPDIEKLAQRKGIPLRRLSGLAPAENPGADDVWLLDQMGVLAGLYEAADAVFIGGSLVPAGGHNLVEPAYFEKPIFIGPFTHNFAEMAGTFKKEGAAVEVRDADELKDQLESLIGDPARRLQLGRAAKRLVRGHQGAAEKSKELLAAVYPPQQERKLVSA